MLLRLTGEPCIFSAVNPDHKKQFYVPWEISPTAPIGAVSHLQSLKTAIRRDFLDDIVFFRLDPRTAQPLPQLVDPSLSSMDLKLPTGTFLYASVNPIKVLGVDGLKTALQSTPGRPVPWVTLTSSSLRFGAIGSALSSTTPSSRGVVKRRRGGASGSEPRNSVDGDEDDLEVDSLAGSDNDKKGSEQVGKDNWVRSVALCETPLSTDGITSFSVCIRWERTNVESEQNKTEGAGAGTTIEDELSATLGSSGKSRALHRLTKPAFAHGNPAFETFPHLAVGLSDGDIPSDESSPQHREYGGAFMLDIASGAFYLGTQRGRPIFADSHTYHPADGMVLTFRLDCDTGVLNILQEGHVVLVASIPSHLADDMHPCVELYTEGAAVELV
jgi:hypothetical protein